MTNIHNPLNIKQSKVKETHYFRFNILTRDFWCVLCGKHQQDGVHITTNVMLAGEP